MNIKKTLSEKDIQDWGFKSGLEIHQQLEGKKLFCSCPTILRDDTPDFTVQRQLRASAGESGVIDAAALAEVKKEQYYIYQGYNSTTCLVELDEMPPGPLNEQSLYSGIQIAKLLAMTPVDQLRVMRKIVVNGSNTSGFQRTSLLAQDGILKTSAGDVRIDSLSLEEDSSKDIERGSNYTTYNLSRLGIPLLEIATAPDLKSPEHVAEAASEIGMILRSIKNIKRGLGTIRQDVNISIAKGKRVEIKGAQDLKLIPQLACGEALRQYNMIEIFSELKKRKASVSHPQIITSIATSESKVIQAANGEVIGAKLQGFAGILGIEVQPGRRYGSELSDHAKLMGVKGLFHSDELPKYGITQEEKKAVAKELHCDENDAFIIIAAPQSIATKAITAALERAKDFSLRQEVRAALPDGTTKYLRPMPGASRMYPETDVPAVVLDPGSVKIPQLLSEKIHEHTKKYGVDEAMAKRLLRDGYDLDELTKTYPRLKPSQFSDMFYSLSSRVDGDIKQHFPTLLQKLNDGTILKDSLEPLAQELATTNHVDYAKYKPLDLQDIKQDIQELVQNMSGAPRGAIIGKAMNAYKGRVDGKALAKLVNDLL